MNDRFAPEPVMIALLGLALKDAYLYLFCIFQCLGVPPSQLVPGITKLVQALLG